MRFPAYGNAFWQRRLLGARPRVVMLLVGNRWKIPPDFGRAHAQADIPRIAVKTAPWHLPTTERYDWRLVVDCTVLAIDVRGPDEREAGPEGWDPWLWLLSDVQNFARDVILFTITEEFHDQSYMWAPERTLEVYAWCHHTYVQGAFTWPIWWPHGRRIFDRAQPLEAAA